MLRVLRVGTPRCSRAASSLPGAPSSWTDIVPPPVDPSPSATSIPNDTEALPDTLQELAAGPSSSAGHDTGPPVGKAYGPPKPSPPNPVTILRHTNNSRPYALYVTATRNNTIATFTRPGGQGLATYTGGKCGFKGQKRATFEAGYQCAMQVFKVMEEQKKKDKMMTVEVFLSGFGQGRDAMFKALMSGEGQEVKSYIHRVTDRTPIQVGGTRAKKMRRS